jgi:rod shape-determining protein MreB
MAVSDIGIDLGTSSVLVYVRGKGVVLKEPSVVAYDKDTNEILAIGEEANAMIGRLPGNVSAVHPLRQGVISDYTITEKMLRYFMQKAIGRRTLRRPRVCIGVPSGATEVERNAVWQAAMEAGARDVVMIDEPIAAALGSGIDISRACGNMVIDIGAGTTDIAVISLNDTVVSRSLKIAGDSFDASIIRYMRAKHNLLIGDRTAEDVKIKIGSVYRRLEPETAEIKGRDLLTGFPKAVKVSSEDMMEAFQDDVSKILESVHAVLEQTPPELASDIVTRGILLTGGSSRIFGLDILVEETTGIETIAIDDPISAVAIGTGRYVEFMEGKQGRGRI